MSDNSRRRITVLRDFSYATRPGEEELAIERFLQAAPEHVAVSVQPPEFADLNEPIKNADVLITFSIKRYPDEVFDLILAHPRHIHVSQDWWEPTQPQASYRNQIIEQAALVVFSSLLHQDRYEKIHQVKPDLAWTIPFPMLESDWATVYPDVVNEDAALWCAPWHPDYGNDLMLSWAVREQQNVHAFGLEVPTKQLVPLVAARGAIALDAASPTFSAYSRFVYFPRKPIPFGFPVLLAWKLGLELTYSGEIGCLSWENEEDSALENLVNVCAGSPETFWHAVEEVAA